MSVADLIKQKLIAELAPTHIEVVDESHLHAGHVGARPEGETHFRVTVVSQAFAGGTRVRNQRLVHGILAEELAGPVHALSVKASAPDGPSRGSG